MTNSQQKTPLTPAAWIAQIERQTNKARSRKPGDGLDRALASLREPCPAAQENPAVFRQGFMAAIGGLWTIQGSEGFGALAEIAKKNPGALGAIDDPVPKELLFQAAVTGNWEPLHKFPALAARMGSAASLAQWTPEHANVLAGGCTKQAVRMAEAAAMALGSGAPREKSEMAALSRLKMVLLAALDERCRNPAVAKKWLAQTPSSPARTELLGDLLCWAAARNYEKGAEWLLKAGAADSPGAIERALEANARYPAGWRMKVADVLLKRPVDWSQCRALGMALAWGNEAGAEAMLAAGAPANGPASQDLPRGFQGVKGAAGWEKLRPEPLAGAALLMKENKTRGLRWIKRLVNNGAQIAGCEPEKSAVAKIVINYGNAAGAESVLRALEKMGGLRPEAWAVVEKGARSYERQNAPEAGPLDQLSQELKARSEQQILSREVARAKVRQAKKREASANRPGVDADAGSKPKSRAIRI